MKRIATKEASVVAKTLIKTLKPFIPLILTITSDNGKEFFKQEKIAKQLKAEFYFAHPYHS